MSSRRTHQLMALGHTRNKFGAIKTRVDGILFDSKREAAVYASLKMLEKVGKISDLTVHPRLDLMAAQWGTAAPAKIGAYEADFAFVENGTRKWVDVKGVMTPFARWKIKHVKAQYGIEVEIWK